MRTILVAVPGFALAAGLGLEDLEKLALDRNPAIAQAAAAVRAAEGRRVQAGLYPNPTIGVTGDEVNPGPTTRWGEFGGFIEQRIVMGGKLGLDRKVAGQAVAESNARADGERHRVLNMTRQLFYQALADQRLIEVRAELADVARNTLKITRELANVGIADKPDLLAVEIETQRAELALEIALHGQARTWRQLSAVVNQTLAVQPLEGSLEAIPVLDLASAMARIDKESPDLKLAQAMLARDEAALERARREPVPDLRIRSGLRYNRELLEINRRPLGAETFFDVGVEIPVFNRNQGNIAAARAERERARLGGERVRLVLRARLAETFREYQDAIAAARRYRDEMIPRAGEAHQMYLANFRRMAAPYPNVLMTQRNLFQLREDYVMALASAWRAVVEVQGLLVQAGGDMHD